MEHKTRCGRNEVLGTEITGFLTGESRRHAGSDVEQDSGFSPTNLALSQIWASRYAFFFGEYERAAAGSNPRMSISSLKNAWQVLKKVSRLLGPLSTDGVGVDAILVAVIFENAAR